MDWFQTEEQKNIFGLYSFLFSHIYVLLFFCLKNVIKKYVFCPENSVKLCALRIEPVKMI